MFLPFFTHTNEKSGGLNVKIALMEHLPILETFLIETAGKSPFQKNLTIEKVSPDETYDLILSDLSWYSPKGFSAASMILIPSYAHVIAPPENGLLLTGGMNQADPVTLSSIREDRAMLCLQQEISLFGNSVYPFEKPIPFNRSFSLYKNLAVGFALSLAEQIFGEDV